MESADLRGCGLRFQQFCVVVEDGVSELNGTRSGRQRCGRWHAGSCTRSKVANKNAGKCRPRTLAVAYHRIRFEALRRFGRGGHTVCLLLGVQEGKRRGVCSARPPLAHAPTNSALVHKSRQLSPLGKSPPKSVGALATYALLCHLLSLAFSALHARGRLRVLKFSSGQMTPA